jgi:hypothetical protein
MRTTPEIRIKEMKDYLKGKKTYVTAFLAVVTAVGSYVLGEIAMQDMIEAVFAALTAMTIRAAMILPVISS